MLYNTVKIQKDGPFLVQYLEILVFKNLMHVIN
jgi:hypothetical protein